jgi:hypothetical protein
MNSDQLFEQAYQGAPQWTTNRWKRLDWLWRVYHGLQYTHLRYPFSQERQPSTNEYIPLHERQPSVRYGLAKIIVKDSADHIFVGRNWPQIATDDQKFTDWLDDFYLQQKFSAFGSRVATLGSIGSVVPIFRITADEKLVLDVWNARDCVPVFSQDGDLDEVMLRYITTASALRSIGIEPDRDAQPNQKFWYRRKLTRYYDAVYRPTPENDWDESKIEMIPIEPPFSIFHGFGIVPALWVHNLPCECFTNDPTDGTSSFGDTTVLDCMIQIDYLLSQTGRGLKYASDPTLILKDPLVSAEGGDESPLVKGVSAAIEVTDKGDAKILEINGGAQRVCIEFVEKLRNFALEVARGSRKDPQRALSHAQSGKMAEHLDEAVMALTAELRTAYGNGFMVSFTQKLIAAFKLRGMGGPIVRAVTPELVRSIQPSWGSWYEPTPQDQVLLGQSLEKGTKANLIDYTSARRIFYNAYDRLVPKTVNWETERENVYAVTLSVTPPTPPKPGMGADGVPTAPSAPERPDLSVPEEEGVNADPTRSLIDPAVSPAPAEPGTDGDGAPDGLDVLYNAPSAAHGS